MRARTTHSRIQAKAVGEWESRSSRSRIRCVLISRFTSARKGRKTWRLQPRFVTVGIRTVMRVGQPRRRCRPPPISRGRSMTTPTASSSATTSSARRGCPDTAGTILVVPTGATLSFAVVEPTVLRAASGGDVQTAWLERLASLPLAPCAAFSDLVVWQRRRPDVPLDEASHEEPFGEARLVEVTI